MDDNMLEFAQSYEGVFKPKFEEKVDKFLDTMVQDSAVNVGENKATSDEYRGVLKEIDNLNATLNLIISSRNTSKVSIDFRRIITIFNFYRNAINWSF